MKRWQRALLQLALVIIVVFFGVLITKRLIATRPKLKKTRPEEVAPLVKAKRIHLSKMQLTINTQGTVRPSKKIDLVPQVSGIVLKVSPGLVKGGRFKKDELLIKIDDADYIAALKKAKAELKAQEAKLSRLREESKQAEAEWKETNPETEPPPLLLKIPDIRATEAAVQAAKAAIQQAELNLSRTELKAPFNGVTLNENIDEGQFIRAGQPVATLFSDDAVEITVNLTEKEAGFIDIPGFNTSSKEGSPSVVSAQVGAKTYQWNGRVVRAEPVDEKTRTIPVVIRVKDPYSSLPPLAVGLFADVKIRGKLIKAATLIEKTAIHFDEKGKTYVWLVNKENRLKKQYVRVIQSTDGQYMITGGISDGTRIVLRAPSQAVEGMKVKIGNGE